MCFLIFEVFRLTDANYLSIQASTQGQFIKFYGLKHLKTQENELFKGRHAQFLMLHDYDKGRQKDAFGALFLVFSMEEA